MSYPGTHAGLQQYRQVNTQARVESASPHRLIQMLMQGALDRIATARGAMERGEIAAKGEQISWAISIVGGLRSSLDLETGGELAGNLRDLYDYMERQLLQANIRNEVALLDEVSGLIREIKSAWDQVGDQPPQAVGG
ncbi:B-type flagellar protein FliS [Thiohalobacter sp. COW1]|uniref:Flagellar secretion chaperone FliS n=1 Tax=Thiohalobacter thiocyanaticus TaxID=585455 RepID=A0A1Z4VQF8_9GAMM|nr:MULTISPECIES: flagellar export chaperone FliS [Thiohalobacter]BAZ93861.1 flagellin-specific chaperone [Thiohalobacter thiocyanaticus]BCO31078.1 B-type flagellar protein FliS [Thiohalobacter sp. COW1]